MANGFWAFFFNTPSTITPNTVTVDNPGPQSSAVGEPVNLQIVATDSDSSQVLTYSSLNLPDGLSIDPGTGLITGTPTTVETRTGVNAIAKDGTGVTGKAKFAWTITAPASQNLELSITSSQGVDQYGNEYLAGLTSYDTATGGATNIQGAVTLVYDVTPALGQLVFSESPYSDADQYGNAIFAGKTWYANMSGTWIALNIDQNIISWSTATSPEGPYTIGPFLSADQTNVLSFSGVAQFLNAIAAVSTVVVGASSITTGADLEIHSLIGIAAKTAPATPPSGFGYLYVNSTDGSLHYKGASGTDTKIAAG